MTYDLRTQGKERSRRIRIEKEFSINSQPPTLAAMAGLCTPPFFLCKIVAVDVLHVRFHSLVFLWRFFTVS